MHDGDALRLRAGAGYRLRPARPDSRAVEPPPRSRPIAHHLRARRHPQLGAAAFTRALHRRIDEAPRDDAGAGRTAWPAFARRRRTRGSRLFRRHQEAALAQGAADSHRPVQAEQRNSETNTPADAGQPQGNLRAAREVAPIQPTRERMQAVPAARPRARSGSVVARRRLLVEPPPVRRQARTLWTTCAPGASSTSEGTR